jgi:two-component system LytT family response regulator
MKRIKVIIVDDEFLARKRIRKLLSKDEELKIVAEFELGKDAVDFINSHRVDIVFLDIHMPELNGFSVLEKIDEERIPFIIFATADKESALKAFEHKALDYLLKPFRAERFYESLQNAKRFVALKKKAELSENLLGIVDNFQNAGQASLELTQEKQIDFDDILYIQSDRNYLKIYQNKNDFILIRKTMDKLHSELAEESFLRIHRSILVNTYFIQSIDYLGNNEFSVKLHDSVELKSSRSYKAEIEKFLTK